MRVVLIGDVSWKGTYHLGDEAMTEVAIAELRKRGVTVTLIAGEPSISTGFYNVDSVSRFGFQGLDEKSYPHRLEAILDVVRGRGDPFDDTTLQTIEAVSDADAVVIAGGGNLNSSGPHHLYERLTLKRLAEHLEIPLYVSSQTVGPHLTPPHRRIVSEIASYARVFGARERSTAGLLRGLEGKTGKVVHTLDDAVLLEPSESFASLHEEFDLPGRYVVGSFTFHASSTGLMRKNYHREIAELLDDIAEQRDIDILLLPHLGALNTKSRLGHESDVVGHKQIVKYSSTGRIRALPMLSARDLLCVTSRADFTISTRYHPVVFGTNVGVPAVGLISSYYSAVRMRGALANVGMESFALPFESWRPLFGRKMLQVLTAKRSEIEAHMTLTRSQQRAYQERWWDGIVADMRGDGPLNTEDLPVAATYDWAGAGETEMLSLARIAQEGTNLHQLHNSVAERETKKRLNAAEKQIAKLQNEIIEMRHQMRPPGASLRDGIRQRMLRWKRG